MRSVVDTNDEVRFVGDSPLGGVEEFHRLKYAKPSEIEIVKDIYYTSGGMAWQNRTLFERYSFREPSLREIIGGLYRGKTPVIPKAIILESSTPYTYGDWFSEHLLRLIQISPTKMTIVLPEKLNSRSYVHRDLAKINANVVFSGNGVLISEAHIHRRVRPGHFFLPDEVAKYRSHFGISDRRPRRGSLTYLSRFGVKSDAYDRAYPSEVIEGLVSSLSGKIIRTAIASDEDYAAAAEDVETVIADFGSAILNLINWNVKRLIIIYSPDWLDVAPFFLCKALNIVEIHLIDHTRYESNKMKDRIVESIGAHCGDTSSYDHV